MSLISLHLKRWFSLVTQICFEIANVFRLWTFDLLRNPSMWLKKCYANLKLLGRAMPIIKCFIRVWAVWATKKTFVITRNFFNHSLVILYDHIYDHISSHMIVYDHIWSYMIIYDHDMYIYLSFLQIFIVFGITCSNLLLQRASQKQK